MDIEHVDVLDGTQLEKGNSTQIVIEATEDTEPLSIIVWCVGGILLITLLSLLGRIILAKRKHPFQSLHENGDRSPRRSNVFRIRLDGPEYNGYPYQPRPGHQNVVPGHMVTQQSFEPYTRNQPAGDTSTVGQHSSNQRAGSQQVLADNNQRGTVSGVPYSARSSHCSNFVQNTPSSANRPSSFVPNGGIASINGYIISPPPYQQVVSSSGRLPSVIVARQQPIPARRLDFSL